MQKLYGSIKISTVYIYARDSARGTVAWCMHSRVVDCMSICKSVYYNTLSSRTSCIFCTYATSNLVTHVPCARFVVGIMISLGYTLKQFKFS